MLACTYERRFKKDVELAKKRGNSIKKLEAIMRLLLDGKPLPPKNRNHKLQGDFRDCWECHIEPDWLLIYKKASTEIIFVRTGSHADLF